MYDSAPKEREGEPLENVVPDAVYSTASREGEAAPRQRVQTSVPDWVPEGRDAFAAVAVLALVEALVILGMLLF